MSGARSVSMDNEFQIRQVKMERRSEIKDKSMNGTDKQRKEEKK